MIMLETAEQMLETFRLCPDSQGPDSQANLKEMERLINTAQLSVMQFQKQLRPTQPRTPPSLLMLVTRAKRGAPELPHASQKAPCKRRTV